MKKIIGYKNSNILTEEGIIKTNIVIKDDIIYSIGNMIVDGMITLSDDLIIVPGFIDQHMHGCCGYEVMNGTKQAIKKISDGIKCEGVTTFVATTSTNSIECIDKSLNAISEFIQDDNKELPELLGVHLEGPFISKIYRGAHLEEYIIKPNVSVMKHFIDSSNNNIRIVTYAPEEDENNEFLKFIKKYGIIPSVGHSNETYKNISNLIKNGLKSVTHTYNAQKGIHHREVGVVGASLLFDELYTELICDGIHVSKEAVKLLVKNKPIDKIVLITDSLSVKGLKDGIYQEIDQIIIMKNHEPRLIDGTLAGSTLKMNKAIKNLIDFTYISFSDAIKCATENPAKLLNIFDKVGSIQEGKLANFAVVDKDLNVYQTVRCGRIIFEKEK